MPTTPKVTPMKKDSVDVLNAIRNSASPTYRSYVPVASRDLESLRHIGGIMQDFAFIRNEFLNALVNRIGRVLVQNKMYSNPLAIFKQGMMEYGETVEDIFVDLCKPHQYDPEVASQQFMKREIPDVKSVFHIMNYTKFYKVTIQNKDLKLAFMSLEGVNDLIAKITNSMYASAAYDELLITKYMIAKSILNGLLYPVEIATGVGHGTDDTVVLIKEISNDYTFMKRKYNAMGVANYADKQDQYLLTNANFDAKMDVEVLAAAFNMSKAEFAGHRLLVDSFGDLDTARLTELLGDDPEYTPISGPELEALKVIPAILVDKKWFMIFDNMVDFTEDFNGEGLYWQYWYHTWKTFSTSPFANASVFVPGKPAVTSVTVSPSSVTAAAGQTVQLATVVETENFASQAVTWESNSPEATIAGSGLVKLSPDASGSITITAKSVFNPEQTGTCTITVSP